ncbi:branched-chain amino acid transport system permease protein [Azospirillaceae bacterium]
MVGILASMLDGVLVGAVYGLAAIGLTLIWGVMDVINLTHGAMIALGMFGLYLLFDQTGIMPYAALVPVAAGGFVVGLVIYWSAVHRMIGRPHLMSLLATFSVNMVLIGLGTIAWSTSPYNINYSVPGVSLDNYTFTGNHLLAAVAAVLIAGGLYLYLHHTRGGKAIRAVASNKRAAELMGIPSSKVLARAFGLGIALAAVSGALIATLFPFTVLSGGSYELKSFVVTVLGGLGNPAGALMGGILLGLIEGGLTPFIAVSWIPVIEFGLFVLILIAFPSGLFAKSNR